MKTLQTLNFVLVALLGLTAGIPKLMRTPQEVGFFADLGLGEKAVVVFGFAQLLGGILLLVRRTRIVGAGVVATLFLGSAMMLVASGQLAFGLISLLPVGMAALAMKSSIAQAQPAR